MTAGRDAVGHEMLQGRDHTLVPAVVQGRHATDQARSHRRRQAGVLAVGFLDPGPAGLPGQVDDRTVADAGPHSAELLRHRASDLLHQGRVPGSGHRNPRGEDGRPEGHVTVGRFFRQEDGDAEARRIDRIALDRVECGDRGRGVQAVLEGLAGPGIRPEEAPEHASVLVPDEIHVGVAIRGLRRG